MKPEDLKKTLPQPTKSSEILENAPQVVKEFVKLDDNKEPWKSKTLWTAAVVAIAPAFPPLGAAIAANPELAGVLVGFVFGLLRMVTSSGVKVK